MGSGRSLGSYEWQREAAKCLWCGMDSPALFTARLERGREAEAQEASGS